MKKRLWILLALTLVLGLTACEEKSRQVQGLVTEVQTGEDGALTAFVVQTRGGEQVGVLLTEKTFAVPAGEGHWSGEEIRTAFQADLQPDVQISSACLRPKKTMTTRDGQEIDAYVGDRIVITGRLNRGAVKLRDGTPVDVLEDIGPAVTGTRVYRLSDGTELLRAGGPRGPEGHYVGNLESFDDLSERAQEKVRAWYEARGPLFDEPEELEGAYAAWRKQGEDFQCRWVEQDVVPSASSGRVMYFGTYVTLPLDHGDSCAGYSLDLGDAFDRETGEHLSLWDLFRCSKEEAKRAILDAALDWPGSGEVRAEMEAAFSPERVIFNTNGLSISYEPGSLPSQEHGYYISADWNKISSLMVDWAVPEL